MCAEFEKRQEPMFSEPTLELSLIDHLKTKTQAFHFSAVHVNVAAASPTTEKHHLVFDSQPSLTWPLLERLVPRAGYYNLPRIRGHRLPFVFDQFVQGQRSAYASGDVHPVKWIAISWPLSCDLNAQLLHSRLNRGALLLEEDRRRAPKLLQMMWPHLL